MSKVGKARRSLIYWQLFLSVPFCLFPAVALAQLPQLPPAAPQEKSVSEDIHVEVRIGDGKRSAYHLGEIVPVSLIYTSTAHVMHRILIERCEEQEVYPVSTAQALEDRQKQRGIANPLTGSGYCMGGHGFSADIDMAEKPFVVPLILNRKYLLDKPGTYPLTWIGQIFGTTVTSNTTILTLLPHDRAWEASELVRATALLDTSENRNPNIADGCTVLRYLDTPAATLEMARRSYRERGGCGDSFREPLVNALNRDEVLKILSGEIKAPDFGVTPELLRTAALISVYQQHPGWDAAFAESHPAPTSSEQTGGTPSREDIRREFVQAELHYIQLTGEALATKQANGGARCVVTLLSLLPQTGDTGLPPSTLEAIQKKVPDVILEMHPLDQAEMFRSDWPRLRSPVMEAFLEKIFADSRYINMRGMALRAFIDVAPDKARRIVVQQITAPDMTYYSVEQLSMLPDKELPEVDATLYQEMVKGYPPGNYENLHQNYLRTLFLIHRFASSAIEEPTIQYFNDHFADMNCEERFNLLAYFHRVDPPRADVLFHRLKFAQTPVTSDKTDPYPVCTLQPLAQMYWSPAIEAQEIANLDGDNINLVKASLQDLKIHGSVAVRDVILKSFTRWNAEWKAKTPLQIGQLDFFYLEALSYGWSWNTSTDEITRYGNLCVSDICHSTAQREIVTYRNERTFILPYSQTWNDSDTILYSIGSCCGAGAVGDLEHAEVKIAEYAEGTMFRIDMRTSPDDRFIDKVKGTLVAWMTTHGYKVDILR